MASLGHGELMLITILLAAHTIDSMHDDVIKWKHFPRYWPFVWGIHRWPVNSPHKGQWRGALMFWLICAWINGWVNIRKAGNLRHHRVHYDVTAKASINRQEYILLSGLVKSRSREMSITIIASFWNLTGGSVTGHTSTIFSFSLCRNDIKCIYI